jgi:hypothetical protein
LNGKTSDWHPVISGVPQGTVLGPLLFLLYVNDIGQLVKNNLRLFADDSMLFAAVRDDHDKTVLQADLDAICKWSEDWMLRFNVTKSCHLSISRKRHPKMFNFTMNGEVVPKSENARYLGAAMNSSLSWNDHIKSIAGQASRTLGFLKRNFYGCSKNAKLALYKSLVRSKLEYCSSVWDPYTKTNIDLLEAIQNRAARFIANNYNHNYSVSALKSAIGLQSLEQRRQTARLCTFYKFAHGEMEIPTDPHPQLASPVHNTRYKTNHDMIFLRHNCNTDVYRNSFFPRTIRQWNFLDQSTIHLSLPAFRTQIAMLPLLT